jgi:hypothetical protein
VSTVGDVAVFILPTGESFQSHGVKMVGSSGATIQALLKSFSALVIPNHKS